LKFDSRASTEGEDEMSDYQMYIPFVNRVDLLDKAVASAKDLWEELTIIDNSPTGLEHPYPDPIKIFRPCVPLTFSQTMNLMTALTKKAGASIILWMHSDAAAEDGVCLKLLELARQYTAEGRKWGCLWTAYDAFSALNVPALDDIGGWDTVLPWYYSDTSTYYAMKMKGWECIDTGLPVKHTPSQTIKSDPELNFLNSVTFPLYGWYYQERWGGQPGHERFKTPFNR
jgi:hypothetical protein